MRLPRIVIATCISSQERCLPRVHSNRCIHCRSDTKGVAAVTACDHPKYYLWLWPQWYKLLVTQWLWQNLGDFLAEYRELWWATPRIPVIALSMVLIGVTIPCAINWTRPLSLHLACNQRETMNPAPWTPVRNHPGRDSDSFAIAPALRNVTATPAPGAGENCV